VSYISTPFAIGFILAAHCPPPRGCCFRVLQAWARWRGVVLQRRSTPELPGTPPAQWPWAPWRDSVLLPIVVKGRCCVRDRLSIPPISVQNNRPRRQCICELRIALNKCGAAHHHNAHLRRIHTSASIRTSMSSRRFAIRASLGGAAARGTHMRSETGSWRSKIRVVHRAAFAAGDRPVSSG
jgi:hypothetical protein